MQYNIVQWFMPRLIQVSYICLVKTVVVRIAVHVHELPLHPTSAVLAVFCAKFYKGQVIQFEKQCYLYFVSNKIVNNFFKTLWWGLLTLLLHPTY